MPRHCVGGLTFDECSMPRHCVGGARCWHACSRLSSCTQLRCGTALSAMTNGRGVYPVAEAQRDPHLFTPFLGRESSHQKPELLPPFGRWPTAQPGQGHSAAKARRERWHAVQYHRGGVRTAAGLPARLHHGATADASLRPTLANRWFLLTFTWKRGRRCVSTVDGWSPHMPGLIPHREGHRSTLVP